MASQTHTLASGKSVTINGLPARTDRVTMVFTTSVADPHSIAPAIKTVMGIRDQLLEQLALTTTYAWRSNKFSDESGLAARLAEVEKQLMIAITDAKQRIDDSVVNRLLAAPAFAVGIVQAEERATYLQLALDAADLTHCCVLDEIEAVHYDISYECEENFEHGEAVVYTGNDGEVTNWELMAKLEALYTALNDVQLVAVLDKSRVTAAQHAPLKTTHDGRIIDSQLMKTYYM